MSAAAINQQVVFVGPNSVHSKADAGIRAEAWRDVEWRGHSRFQRHQLGEHAVCQRQRVHLLAGNRVAFVGRRRIYDWRSLGNRDRFSDGTYRQHGVDTHMLGSMHRERGVNVLLKPAFGCCKLILAGELPETRNCPRYL